MVDSRSGSNLLYLPLDRLLQQAGTPVTAGTPATAVPSPAAAESAGTQSIDVRSRDNSRTRDREGR